MYNYTKFAIELNEPEPYVAPTDSRLRPDQRLLEEGNCDKSNEIKSKLEEKQRAKRRDNHEHKPVWFDQTIENDETKQIAFVYNNKYWDCKRTQSWDECPDIY